MPYYLNLFLHYGAETHWCIYQQNAWPFSPNVPGVSFDTGRWGLSYTIIFVCFCKNSSSFYWAVVLLGLVDLKHFVRPIISHRTSSLGSIMKMLLMSNWSTVRDLVHVRRESSTVGFRVSCLSNRSFCYSSELLSETQAFYWLLSHILA